MTFGLLCELQQGCLQQTCCDSLDWPGIHLSTAQPRRHSLMVKYVRLMARSECLCSYGSAAFKCAHRSNTDAYVYFLQSLYVHSDLSRFQPSEVRPFTWFLTHGLRAGQMLCTLLASERPLTESYAYADHVCNIWEERKRQDDHQIAGGSQSLLSVSACW